MLSVNKSGNLKIQRRKCRLMKKSDLVKVAQNMGVNTTKKTIPQICASMKASMNNIPLAKLHPRAKAKANMNNIPLAKLYPQPKPKANMNNIPLAKLYPQAKPKPKAKPKATAANKKVAMNFMKGMVTTNNNVAKLRNLNVKPSKKAQPLTVDQASKRIMAMKSLTTPRRKALVVRMKSDKSMSPRRYVKMAREMGRLA